MRVISIEIFHNTFFKYYIIGMSLKNDLIYKVNIIVVTMVSKTDDCSNYLTKLKIISYLPRDIKTNIIVTKLT